MNISIIGSGYVGLVTAACFASSGHKVTCLDVEKSKIAKLKKGNIPIHEPGLKELIQDSLRNKAIEFTSDYKEACLNDIFFLCVGTPDKNGKPDLSYLNSVIDSLIQKINKDSYIFIKSTVPLGTNSMIEKRLNAKLNKRGINIKVASNPEFLKEGSAIDDFLKPDRIIVGTSDSMMKSIASEIFKPFNWQKSRIIFMTVESSELTKYAANAFLATKISFMNEISLICDQVGADVHEIRAGIGSDTRIGSSFLYAGLGYGGSCFPKDVNSLIFSQKKLGLNSYILNATKKVNEEQVNFFLEKINKFFPKQKSKVELALWGLSFKPGTDDIRESIAIKLLKKLSKKFKSIAVYDPLSVPNSKKELADFKNIVFHSSKYRCISANTEALIICTEWKEFWTLEEKKLRNIKAIFDGRNILSALDISSTHIEYFGIGTSHNT